jgi:uncharacterized membrane protein YsdA (DUF1294 family)
MVLYGIDKYKAKNECYRIPEKTLLLGALFGPFGAYIGMRLFRHKTRKPKFSIGVPLLILLHVVLLTWFQTGFFHQ